MLKTINEGIEKGEITIKDFLKGTTRSKSKSTSRLTGNERMVSIINSKVGSKIVFANTVLKHLGDPSQIQISYNNNKKIIIIGKYILDKQISYTLKKSGSKCIIYNKNLVKELTAAMKLDFTLSTSITFQEIQYVKEAENSIAIIKVS